MNTTPTPAETGFAIENGIDIPPVTRSGGGTSPYPLATMTDGQSFLIPVSVSDKIKDEAERLQSFKEEARKVSNRLSGAVRRHRKHVPDSEFALRTVAGEGVRCWCVKAGKKKA